MIGVRRSLDMLLFPNYLLVSLDLLAQRMILPVTKIHTFIFLIIKAPIELRGHTTSA